MTDHSVSPDLRQFAADLAPMVEAAPSGPFLWGATDSPTLLAEAAAATEAHGDAQPQAWVVQTTDPDDAITMAYCGNGPRSHHTAELIAYLLNNAPALAALQASPAPLDAAWAEAEAALPEGWAIDRIVHQWEGPKWPAWWAAANRGDGSLLRADGPTPAVALHALAARLQSVDPA